MPLDYFLRLQDDRSLSRYAARLRKNDTVFIQVTLKRGRSFSQGYSDCHWLFFAGPEIFYRASMMHAFRPMPEQSLIAEATYKGGLKRMGPKEIEKKAVSGLVSAGVIKRASDIKRVGSRRLACTYPIPTLGLRTLIGRIERNLAERNIYIIGRSGRWDYINIDQVAEKVWEFFRTSEALS